MNIKREDDNYIITVGNVRIVSEGLYPLLVMLGMVLFIIFATLAAIF